jgi:hypothetical protein
MRLRIRRAAQLLDPVWSKNWNGRRTCSPWSVASLPGRPELGQRIAKVFCGFRDLLITAAESEFGIEPDWACGHAAS